MKTRGKSFLCFVILLVYCVVTFPVITVSADAATRVKTNIAFAQGKSFSDFDEADLAAMTYEDLRMMGVFLSNFYVPWGTVLSGNNQTEEMKEDMINVMTQYCGLSDEVAEAFVPLIWEMSLSTAKPLAIGTINKSGTFLNPLADENNNNTVVDKFDNSSPFDENFYYYTFTGAGQPDEEFWLEQTAADSDFANAMGIKGSYYNFLAVLSGDAPNSDELLQFGDSKITGDTGSGYMGKNHQLYDRMVSPSSENLKNHCLYWVDSDGKSHIVFDTQTAWGDVDRLSGDVTGDYNQNPDPSNAYFSPSSLMYSLLNDDANYRTGLAGALLGVDLETYEKLTDLQQNMVFCTDSQLYVDCFGNILLDIAGQQIIILPAATNPYAWYNDALGEDSVGCNIPLVNLHSISEAANGNITRTDYYDYSFSFYNGENSNSLDVENLTALNLFDEDTGKLVVQFAQAGGTKFSNLNDEASGRMVSYDNLMAVRGMMPYIFLSYAYAYYSNEGENKVSYRYAGFSFPTVEGKIDWNKIEIKSDRLDNELKSMIYYFLHPTEGFGFLKTWAKSKLSELLVSWHEDLVGKSGGTATTGSTKYLGFSGYINVVSLEDVPLTAKLLTMYDTLVIWLILGILLIMLFYVMLGEMTVQRGIVGVIAFAVCIMLPPTLLNSAVTLTNSISDKIYASKFTYWALVQHEQYANQLSTAISEQNQQEYLAAILQQQLNNGTDEYALVRVKWQCPKKEDFIGQIAAETSDSGLPAWVSKMFGGMANEQLTGEDYLEGADNLYLYRSYTDIGSYSKTMYQQSAVDELNLGLSNGAMYKSLVGSSGSTPTQFLDNSLPTRNRFIEDYQYNIAGYLWGLSDNNNSITRDPYSFGDAISKGFIYDTITDRNSLVSPSDLPSYTTNKRIALPLGSSVVTINGLKTVEKAGELRVSQVLTAFGEQTGTYTIGSTDGTGNTLLATSEQELSHIMETGIGGLRHGVLMNGLAEVNGKTFTAYGITNSEFFGPLQSVEGRERDEYFVTVKNSVETENGVNHWGGETDTFNAEMSAIMNFSHYTESPYYYLSYNLQDQLGALNAANTGSTSAKGYSDLFLQENSGYFYNTSTNLRETAAYGEMRDYMDMRSLFSTVIPYLKALNDTVIEWDNTNGLFLYDDISVEYDDLGYARIPEGISDTDLMQKYYHNLATEQLLNIYSPWVDIMYDSAYANAETITVAGEDFVVEDPLNPLSYTGGEMPLWYNSTKWKKP